MKWKVLLLMTIASFIGYFLYNEYAKEEAYPLPDEEQLQSLVNQSELAVEPEVNQQENGGLANGQTPPDFTLTTLDGNEFQLSKYKGKTVILNFWATWCPPCRAEMPDMQKFHEKYQKEDVEIIAVNLTSAERNEDNIQKFIDEFTIDFTIPLDVTGHVGGQYEAFAIPTSYIIDADGNIHQKIIGPMTYEWMELEIKKLLN